MPELDPPVVRKATAVLIGRLGDLIVATPFLKSLKTRYPEAALTLVVGPLGEDAASLIPGIDEVLVLRHAHKVFAHVQLAAALLRGRCDLLVDLNPSFSRTSAALCAFVRSPIKLAFQKGRLDSVFNARVAPAGEKEHMLDRYARLAAALDAPYDPVPALALGEQDKRAAEAILNRAIGSSHRRRILIHPGNFKKFDNRWPEEKFAALTDRLMSDASADVLYMAGPGEEAQVRALVEKLKRRVAILPPAPLGVTGALMKRMDLCVVNITGTTHLAGALGVPTFGFYAGYTAAVWRLRGPQHSGIVSRSWTSCRDIGVDEAWAALQSSLAALKKPLP